MSTDDDEMTPQEREKWLKDRGIQIETASDRKEVNSIMTGGGDRPPTVVEQVQNLSIDGQECGISFVYLPCDTSKPMSNLKLPSRLVEALGGGDVLPSVSAHDYTFLSCKPLNSSSDCHAQSKLYFSTSSHFSLMGSQLTTTSCRSRLASRTCTNLAHLTNQ